jgi:tetratricopeptide (TPR) repeat protein
LTAAAQRRPAPALRPKQAERGQLDASPALFTVLAAINAAGYDDGLNSPSTHPLRKAVRAEIARRKPPVVEKIRDFMREHRQEDANWELRLYISYGLLVSDPPEFEFRLPEYQLPPDVAAMKGLGPLLKRFYEEAGIEELWQGSQPAFDEAIAKYHEPATKAALEVSAYLRSPTSGSHYGQRFHIVVDLLGAPNQIHMRTFLNDYFLVLTASEEPKFYEIRQAYLHYMLDQLVTNNQEKLEASRGLIDYAQGHPYLADHYKDDFLLLATRSLIRAIEARLAPAANRQAMVDQAMSEGFVMTAHFAEQLPLYEKQEQSMRFYFPELIQSIDLRKEANRLEKLDFSTAKKPQGKVRAAGPAPELEPEQKRLEEAEQLYAKQDLEGARRGFLGVVQESVDRSMKGRGYYGLARIALRSRDPELAEKLLEQALEMEPPAVEKSWCLVYLGRLAEAAGEKDRAAERYRAALAVEGGSATARQAAEKGLQGTVK